MRKTLFSVGLISTLVWIAASAQQPAAPAPAGAAGQAGAPATKTYDAKCASCHGPAMTGASAPAILAYVRYHTDAEMSARLREVHTGARAVQLTDDELKQVLADVRAL